MKTLPPASFEPTAIPPIQINGAGIAELYAAACAFEPDPKSLDGLTDLSRISIATTGGSVRRLVEALAMVRGAAMNRRYMIVVALLLVIGAALFASQNPVAPDCAQTIQRCQR